MEPIIDHYCSLADAVRRIASIVSTALLGHAGEPRNRVARILLARASRTLHSLELAWRAGNYEDCWVLFRALLERFFTLEELHHTDEFEEFEAWSFVQRFEARNRLMSDPEMRAKRPSEEHRVAPDERTHYSELKARAVVWRRPNPEKVARRLGMPFLYKYGYDLASAGPVHPLADDGDELPALPESAPTPTEDDCVVLRNSVLALTLLVQTTLNASTLAWNTLIYDAVDEIRRALEAKDKHRVAAVFGSIAAIDSAEGLCRPRSQG